MSNNPDRRHLDSSVGQELRSYTYGEGRGYYTNSEFNGFPIDFWRESIGLKSHHNQTATTQQTEYTDEYVKKQNLVLARAVARYNGWLVFVGFVAAGISYFQWREIQNGSDDTHTLAVSAKDQAKAARISAETARETLVAAQRAWIGPDNAAITQMEVGKPLKATINYKNTGREPAPVQTVTQPRVFVDALWGQFVGSELTILASKANCMESSQSAGFFAFPSSGFGNGYVANVNSQQDPTIDKFDVDKEMIEGGKVIVITGCMTYRTQGKTRHTSFCFFYKPKLSASITSLNICQSGWDAD